MDSADERTSADLAARGRRLRSQLEREAREARQRLADSAAEARAAVERDTQAARYRSEPAGAAPAPAGTTGLAPADLDEKLVPWMLAAAVAGALLLGAGHLSALVVHGGAPSYRLADGPSILWRLVRHPGDPAPAWEPVNTGAEVPGAVAFWLTFVFLVLIVGLLALLVWAFLRTSAPGPSAGWGRAGDLRELRVDKNDRHRLVLAEADGHQLAVPQRHSVLAVGPAHAGKSSGLTVPALLEWEGPAVVATAKGHVVDETIGWRSHCGEVHVYDPAATTRYHRSGWSLLAGCQTWGVAIQTAADLTLAARPGIRDDGERFGDAHGSSALSMSLAPYLLAAVASGRPIGDVVEWIEREEFDTVLDVLTGVDRAAAQVHRLSVTRRDETRRAYLLAMAELLQVYVDPVVGESMDRHEIEPAELLDGGAHTLYLTAPEVDQDRFRPLCAMLVRRMVAAAYELSSVRSAPLDPPLLVVLDDVAGIAPLDDLGGLASTAPGRGVQILSVFQDRRQIDDLYGPRASTLIRNHRVRLVLPGGHRFVGVDDPIVEPDLVGQLGEGEAALAYGSHRPVRVRLRSWFRDRTLRRRAETPQDAVRPAGADAASLPTTTSVADQTARWMRRGRPAEAGPGVGDPSLPLDPHDPSYVEVFGELDDTAPINVTRLTDRRRWRGGT